MSRARWTELGAGGGLGQRSQRGAQRFGLRAKAADPELAALVRRPFQGCPLPGSAHIGRPMKALEHLFRTVLN